MLSKWIFIRQCCFIFSLFFSLVNVLGATNAMPAQFEVSILESPQPMKAEGKYYLVYEVYLTNFHQAPMELTTFGVNTAASRLTWTGQALAHIIYPIGYSYPDEKALIFLPGMTKLVLMWLPFNRLLDIPTSLTHSLTIKGHLHDEEMTLSETTDPLPINQTLPLTISPPLRGDKWFSANGPSNTSEHRVSHLILNGHDYFSQRFAIDFIQIGPNETTYHDNEFNNENYYCYGREIFSVAEGTVVAIKNDIPENIPHSEKTAVPITLDTVGGNYVIIDLGNDKYAFYAHMIPQSLTVKIGEHVSLGQVIGKVGNSGNATEPHLHFHIMNKPSPLAANGIPYHLNHFAIRPSQLIPGHFLRIKILSDKLIPYSNQAVLENNVINFF